MNVYYSGCPENHHYFLKTINKKDDLRNTSLLRFDNHRDDNPIGTLCSSYIRNIKCRFNNIVWVKKLDEELKIKIPGKGGYFLSSFKYFRTPREKFNKSENLNDLIKKIDEELMDKIIIDVDPDVTPDYEWSCYPNNSNMSEDELSRIIDYFSKNKKVLYYFFSSSKSFAERIINNSGINNYKTIKLD